MTEAVEQTTEKNKLYVGNLPFSMNEEDIQNICSTCGHVESVVLVRDRETGRSRGFSFVTFRSSEAVERALDTLDGHLISGRAMRISIAQDRKKPANGNHREGPPVRKYHEKICSHCKTRKPTLVGYSEDTLICAECSRAMSKTLNKTF